MNVPVKMPSWRVILKRFHPEGIPWPGSVFYSAVSGTSVFRRHYELVAEDIKRCGTVGRILDVGTGPGWLLLALRRALPNAVLAGVDISEAMVMQARRNLGPYPGTGEIEIRTAGAEHLPFEDGAFDCIVSTGSLHHWKAPLVGLAEAYRVLRAGGYALVYDLVRNMPPEVAKEVRAWFGGFRYTLLFLHSFEEPFLNPAEMEWLGKQTAFDVEGTRFVGALCCLVLKKP